MAHKTRYQVVGLGGTFDHFHDGHRALIELAARWGKECIIGVTSDKLAMRKSFPEAIQPYAQRLRSVKSFCKQAHIPATCIKLHDVYGTTLDERSTIEALIVTTETVPGAEAINEARTHLKLAELPVHVCPMVLDETGMELHADRIRAGQVSRQGQVYALCLAQNIKLNAAQRAYFQKPHGELVTEPAWISEESMLEFQAENWQRPLRAVVGDVSLEQCLLNSWEFDLAVYDLKSQRQTFKSQQLEMITPHLTCNNPAGQITVDMVRTLQRVMAEQARFVQIFGEEDLAAVALILLLPLGSHILYGEPKGGMRELMVSEKVKLEVFSLLKDS